ncbi:MAG: LacI family transcriptional regulator [Lachnospiraceae bacterium]|nr:LacI family transcriptional regulator [Lachnospiraceae bacterium]
MATLKDVAKEAGLTVTTVSRVLNNRGYISEDARKKVDEAMKKLNYRPNEIARSLQRKSGNMIGLIIPHISHPYFAQLISKIDHFAVEMGYHILLCNTQGINSKVEEYISLCISNRVAGIIICSGSVDSNLVSNLDIPVVCLERNIDNCTASVECDNLMGGRLAATALLDAGCKNPVYIGSISTTNMPADRRYEGFATVCKERDTRCLFYGVDDDAFKSMDYLEILEKLLQRKTLPDGVFASSDVIAIQLLQLCRKYGVQVPEQMKIVGFDDIPYALFSSPPLTTIHQPIAEMAEMAVRIIKRASEGGIVATKSILPVQLIERETI